MKKRIFLSVFASFIFILCFVWFGTKVKASQVLADFEDFSITDFTYDKELSKVKMRIVLKNSTRGVFQEVNLNEINYSINDVEYTSTLTLTDYNSSYDSNRCYIINNSIGSNDYLIVEVNSVSNAFEDFATQGLSFNYLGMEHLVHSRCYAVIYNEDGSLKNWFQDSSKVAFILYTEDYGYIPCSSLESLMVKISSDGNNWSVLNFANMEPVSYDMHDVNAVYSEGMEFYAFDVENDSVWHDSVLPGSNKSFSYALTGYSLPGTLSSLIIDGYERNGITNLPDSDSIDCFFELCVDGITLYDDMNGSSNGNDGFAYIQASFWEEDAVVYSTAYYDPVYVVRDGDNITVLGEDLTPTEDYTWSESLGGVVDSNGDLLVLDNEVFVAPEEDGFFQSIGNWFKGLFGSSDGTGCFGGFFGTIKTIISVFITVLLGFILLKVIMFFINLFKKRGKK